MSRRLRQSAAAWLLVAAGCRFDADYSGTRFACGDVPPRCPPSQACVDGICVSPTRDAGRRDDAPGSADAAAIDDAAADAAAPDAPPMIPTGLEPSADTTLDSEVPADNYGADLELAIRNGTPRSTAVLRFDLSAVAPGMLVAQASLHVHVTAGGEDDAIVEVHRVLETWQEGAMVGAAGAASWQARRDGVAWSGEGAQGGSRGVDVMGEITASGAGEYAVPLDVATVQSWVTSPTNNQGIVLIGVSGSALRLVSREGAAATRPRLELTLAAP